MKSHESDLLRLATCVFEDVAAMCTANSPDYRDLDTLRSRVKHEGLSFLTITLPSLGSDFEQCLSKGFLDPTLFKSFKKRAKSPAFLQGLFGRVFDIGTGRILDEPEVAAVVGIRQIAYTFKKLKLPCADFRLRKAFSEFKEIELDLSEPLASDSIEYFSAIAAILWNSVLGGEFDSSRTIPRHGPGATAEHVAGNRKYVQRRWHKRLETYFPCVESAFPNGMAYFTKEFRNVSLIPEDAELPVRVITVPKTLKAPRIIAIEPVCMQYTQQALSKFLVKELESSPITRGHLNFRSQRVNKRLAMNASRKEVECGPNVKMATLDLSAASDRVPLSLVERMLSCNPNLLRAMLACRSMRAELPGGDILSLRKFASMGSALCFPVESMYFYTICIGALLRKYYLPVTLQNIVKVSRSVYVYGDDIIVPVDAAETVIAELQKYYCKVGVRKSFWSGNFRESCGTDAFCGTSVTPIYLREVRPTNRRMASQIVSWVKTSNLLYKQGYWKTSSHMIKVCEEILGPLPIVSEESAALGKVSFQHVVSIDRWSLRYQSPEVRAWVASPVYRTDKLDGYFALTKCLLRLEELHSSSEDSEQVRSGQGSSSALDEKHLERSARHGAVALKRRWTSPY